MWTPTKHTCELPFQLNTAPPQKYWECGWCKKVWEVESVDERHNTCSIAFKLVCDDPSLYILRTPVGKQTGKPWTKKPGKKNKSQMFLLGIMAGLCLSGALIFAWIGA